MSDFDTSKLTVDPSEDPQISNSRLHDYITKQDLQNALQIFQANLQQQMLAIVGNSEQDANRNGTLFQRLYDLEKQIEALKK